MTNNKHDIISTLFNGEPVKRQNKQGNDVQQIFFPEDRYFFDFKLSKNWKQYDTDQDAHYFGTWVNIYTLQVLAYCEGDVILSTAKTQETFKAELDSMAEYYGKAPPAFTAIDFTNKTVTKYYDKRPTA